MFSGVMGQDFQSSGSIAVTPGTAVDVEVGFAIGVIGEIGFDLRVGVCGAATVAGNNDSTVGAGKVSVGAIILTGVDSAAQPMISITTTRMTIRFMQIRISIKINWK